jgi:glycosyltransferase involved in cell wall biosynthesis
MTASHQTAGPARRIGIVSGVSLAHNPRVLKEASTLAAAGFEVVVVGGGHEKLRLGTDLSLAKRHGFSFQPVDLDDTGKTRRRASIFIRRLKNRLARTAHRFTGWESPLQLGNNIGILFRAAKAIEADYYIVHLEPALWVGASLLQAGFRVGIDIEDWYSEDLLPEARKGRPVKLLRLLEAKLLREGAHSTCTSRAMSDALAKEYNCRPPAVIYNAFPWADRQQLDGKLKDRKDPGIPSIHWYSQTLGYGRGLEDLLAALPYLKHPVEIHLRGNPVQGFNEWLQTHVPTPWRERIFVHGLVSNDDLLSRIAEHDIGFAGEMKYCRNKDLTASNKILHYLLAGLAVVASDTVGQREISQQAGEAVRLYPSGNPPALAAQINALLASSDELLSAKSTALAAAERTFCWERQAPVLLASIENALTH